MDFVLACRWYEYECAPQSWQGAGLERPLSRVGCSIGLPILEIIKRYLSIDMRNDDKGLSNERFLLDCRVIRNSRGRHATRP